MHHCIYSILCLLLLCQLDGAASLSYVRSCRFLNETWKLFPSYKCSKSVTNLKFPPHPSWRTPLHTHHTLIRSKRTLCPLQPPRTLLNYSGSTGLISLTSASRVRPRALAALGFPQASNASAPVTLRSTAADSRAQRKLDISLYISPLCAAPLSPSRPGCGGDKVSGRAPAQQYYLYYSNRRSESPRPGTSRIPNHPSLRSSLIFFAAVCTMV